MSNERGRRTAIRFTFVIGIICAVLAVFSVISILSYASDEDKAFLAYTLVMSIVLGFIPLIAAFISKKRIGIAGIILVVLGLYNIIGDIILLTQRFDPLFIIVYLPDVFVLIAGFLCLRAVKSYGDEINPKKTIREFDAMANIDDIIQHWADNTAFSSGNPLAKEAMDIENNTYCYHSLGMNSCTYITINLADNKAHIKTWIEYDLIVRVLSLFIVPKQQNLDTKSPAGLGARLQPKREVSMLLESLGQDRL